MEKLVVGCGYLGHRVARLWQKQGDTVHVTTRSPDRQNLLSQEGFRTIRLDVTQGSSWPRLPTVDTVLSAVGFDRTAGASIHAVYVDGLQNLLTHLSPDTRRIIQISSTGVYGPTRGGWVDEDSECRPVRVGGQACLAAEKVLQHHPLGSRTIVLRLAGIYGPGRIPRQDAVAQGCPLAARPDGYLNLIHVDDAARTVLAAERRASPPQTFLVSDGNPVQRRVFYSDVARRMGVEDPVFCDSSTDRRSAGSKRVSNRRLLTELGITLRYPTYQEGLAAIFASKSETQT